MRNEDVLNTIQPNGSLEEMVLKQKPNYFGHVMRTKAGFGKDLMLGKIGGNRRRGRPKMIWMQEFK